MCAWASHIDSSILIDDNVDEFVTALNENKNHINNSKTLYYVIQPTANCSLGCGYCGQLHSNKQLTDPYQQAILERLSAKIATPNTGYQELNIGWFGAEPLSGTKIIESLSPKLLSLAAQHNLKYVSNIVTNGLLLNKKIAERLINEYSITGFEITLDGTAEFHDARRHTKKGGETFSKIYKNILDLCNNDWEKKIGVSIRCNVDKRNRDGVIPLLEKLAKDGLNKKVSFYAAPVHSWGNDAHQLSMEKKEHADYEIEWLIKAKELGFSGHFLPQRNKQVCMAVDNNSELVDPFGNIFHCTEISLVPTYEQNKKNIYKVGHLSEGKNIKEEAELNLRDFYNEDKIKQYDCHTCEMFPVCGGACPKEWAEGRIPKFNIKKRMILEYIFNKDREHNKA